MGFAEALGVNIATIGLLIGALLLFLTWTKSFKSGSAANTFRWLGLIGIGLFLAGSFLAQPNFFTNPLGGSGGTTLTTTPTSPTSPTTPTQTTVCAVEDTTVTLSAIDAFTSVATGGSHRYRINGAPGLTVSDAGTFTASPGDKVDILWFNASTTGAYYSAVSSEVVPCAGTVTFDANLYNNGSLTIEVFNEEGNLIDTTSENETLAAGDVVTLPFKLKGAFQDGFPYGFVVIAEFNSTEIDDVIVSMGGSEMEGTPDFFTLAATDHRAKSYTTAPVLTNEILEGTIVIDADDTINPGNADDIDIRVYPINYFIDDDKGGAYGGPSVEDEDDARTYSATFAFTLSTD